MSRRRVLGIVAAGLVAPRQGRAQAGKVWHVGVLDTIPAAQNGANLGQLRQALSELGYVEGRNLVLVYRSADGQGERFEALAAELVAAKVDLIVTRGTPAAVAATKASTHIPVVMASIGEPLLVVASLSRPGGHVTGLSSISSDLEAKRVQLLRELLPKLTHLGALYNMGNPVFAARWREIESASRAVGVQPVLLDVRKADALEQAFVSARQQRVGAMVVGQDGLMQANAKRIAALAAQFKLPAIYGSVDFIDAGGLMAYGPHYPDLYRRAASYVDKILKGAKPGDLPIEQPTRFEMTINLKPARGLGLVIPTALRLRADNVLE